MVNSLQSSYSRPCHSKNISSNHSLYSTSDPTNAATHDQETYQYSNFQLLHDHDPPPHVNIEHESSKSKTSNFSIISAPQLTPIHSPSTPITSSSQTPTTNNSPILQKSSQTNAINGEQIQDEVVSTHSIPNLVPSVQGKSSMLDHSQTSISRSLTHNSNPSPHPHTTSDQPTLAISSTNPTTSIHPMETRSKHQIYKPNPKYSLHTITTTDSSIESTCVAQALKS